MPTRERLELAISGMTCDGCAAHVRRALKNVAAVQSVAVPDWQEGGATVVADQGVPADVLTDAVAAAGYSAELLSRTALEEQPGAVRAGESEVDLAIIGSGSAAFAAAIRASELGYSTLMVEKDTLGGTCVNGGCVPSKTLLRTAEAYHRANYSPFSGVRPRGADLSWKAVMADKDELVDRMRREKYEQVLDAYPSVTLVRGTARLTPEANVAVDGHIYRPTRVLIAAGAHPYVPPLPGADEVDVLTSAEALALADQPESMIVIGGRYVALELAQIFARLGTRVTILQRSARILPDHEPEVTDALTRYLRDEGVHIHTSVDILSLRRDDREMLVEAGVKRGSRTFRATRILAATGRRANTDGLHLETAGVKTDELGAVVVDDALQTTNPRVYAAGDVTGPPMFVYVAAADGRRAAENALLGRRESLDRSVIPAVIFTDPQVATVGLTDAQAKTEGIEVRVSVLPLTYVPRALAARDTRGLIKLVADSKSGHLLGAHVLATEAGEVIQTATTALRAGMRVNDLTDTFFPYLTQAEGLKLAALAFDRDVGKLSCCAG